MTTTTSTTAAFVEFLESTEDPGNLFAHDLFCDFNVPRWRYQLHGVEELAQEIRHEGPNRVNVLRIERTASGFVLEAEVDVRIDNQPFYERTMWLVTTNDDRITAITLYCSGEWDMETKACQPGEAPMLRP